MKNSIYRAYFSSLFAALMLFSLSVAAQIPSDEQIAVKADEFVKAAVTNDNFIGSVMIAKNGKPIFSKGYGQANIELNVPNSPTTVFRLGSITKQFTAAAILKLQEDGKLSVNDAICKHLENCPTAWEKVTIHHLLTHTSGIPSYTGLPDFFPKISYMPISSQDLVKEFRDKPLEFAPGEKYKYNNSGYHLLGLIIEKLSGETYADYLQKNIFMPLGMKNTGYDDTKTIIPNRASGYRWNGKNFQNANYLNMALPYAAGSLYSTTEDLLIWDQSLKTEKVLKKTSLDAMFTPFKDDYAYGWEIGKLGEHRKISHNGGINGFVTDLVRFPTDGVTVIVLSNSENTKVGKISEGLSQIALGMPYKISEADKKISTAILQKYVGDYELAPNFILSVMLEGEKLITQATGQQKIEIFARSEKEFFPRVMEATIVFQTDDKGNATGLVLKQGGREINAKKIK